MSKAVIAIALLFVSVPVFAQADAVINPVVMIEPLLEPGFNEILQPFSGSAVFNADAGYHRPCSLRIELRCEAPLDSTQTLRLARLQPYLFEVLPESLSWEGSLDSGEAFSGEFVFTPKQVGSYELALARRYGEAWQTIARLVLAIDEDGRTIFAGDRKLNRYTIVPPHPHRKQDTLTLVFPLWGNTRDRRFERHFTGEFKFHPAPAPKETTFVFFDLECHYSLYREVQFLLGYTQNLIISELPPSWGNRAGPREGYRHYRGSFWFVPYKAGAGHLKFVVVGSHPLLRYTDRPTTEFPMYFVFEEDGTLDFIGTFNPWERYQDPADPMLGSVTGLVEQERPIHRLKYITSEPDYTVTTDSTEQEESDQ
jgi:hypothetical protein